MPLIARHPKHSLRIPSSMLYELRLEITRLHEKIESIEGKYQKLPPKIRASVQILMDAPDLVMASIAGKTKANPLVAILRIGVHIGQLAALTEVTSDEYRKELAATIGRFAVNKKWNSVNSKKTELISIAETKWAAGDLLLHNEMADELLEDNPEAAKIISKAVLLAALRPVAAKYGKVRGVKGIRKEKLPPK